MNDGVDGVAFRFNYARAEEKLQDSARARRRLAVAVSDWFDGLQGQRLLKRIDRQLGVGFYRSFRDFFQNSDVLDVLSSVTVIWAECNNKPRLRAEIKQIFAEEDLAYRIDDEGGVHHLVDAEFAHLSAEILDGLGSAALVGAREALENALMHLNPERQSGKAVIRGIFEAAENAFLTVINGAARQLNKQALENYLKPLMMEKYQGVPDAEDKVNRQIAAIAAWVHTVHPYRHGASFEEEHEAPLDEAILSATTGMGIIRFLVKMR